MIYYTEDNEKQFIFQLIDIYLKQEGVGGYGNCKFIIDNLMPIEAYQSEEKASIEPIIKKTKKDNKKTSEKK